MSTDSTDSSKGNMSDNKLDETNGMMTVNENLMSRDIARMESEDRRRADDTVSLNKGEEIPPRRWRDIRSWEASKPKFTQSQMDDVVAEVADLKEELADKNYEIRHLRHTVMFWSVTSVVMAGITVAMSLTLLTR